MSHPSIFLSRSQKELGCLYDFSLFKSELPCPGLGKAKNLCDVTDHIVCFIRPLRNRRTKDALIVVMSTRLSCSLFNLFSSNSLNNFHYSHFRFYLDEVKMLQNEAGSVQFMSLHLCSKSTKYRRKELI